MMRGHGQTNPGGFPPGFFSMSATRSGIEVAMDAEAELPVVYVACDCGASDGCDTQEPCEYWCGVQLCVHDVEAHVEILGDIPLVRDPIHQVFQLLLQPGAATESCPLPSSSPPHRIAFPWSL